MIVLNKDVEEVTFEDVVRFCDEQHAEGIQIDYKKDLTNKVDGLSKHFASFANTRGGVIIIGVEEDPTTYKPLHWDGIDKSLEGAYKDKINAWAKNVNPIPDCKIGVTDVKNNKIFILVRILEGKDTPYYVDNYPNIYVRTGDTSHPVSLASAEAQKLLYKKRDEAIEYQKLNIQLSDNVFASLTRKSQRELEILIVNDRKNYKEKNPSDKNLDNYKPQYFIGEFGVERGNCTVIIQPNYPSQALINLKGLDQYCSQEGVTSTSGPFPLVTNHKQTIPEGIVYFRDDKETGHIRCEQVFAKGLIYNKRQIIYEQRGKLKVILNFLAEILYQTLEFGRKFYEKVGYQGSVVGSLELSGVENLLLLSISPNYTDAGTFDFESKLGLLDTYRWDVQVTTNTLSKKEEFTNYYHELLNKVCWDIGYPEGITEEGLLSFMKKNSWTQ
jgi:Putative DNA-binding domain